MNFLLILADGIMRAFGEFKTIFIVKENQYLADRTVQYNIIVEMELQHEEQEINLQNIRDYGFIGFYAGIHPGWMYCTE